MTGDAGVASRIVDRCGLQRYLCKALVFNAIKFLFEQTRGL
jgi:hypothetical protein